jgi:O-antigen/teichoic acid export membrane protein
MQAGRTLFQSILWRGLYYAAVFIINILIARHFQAATSGSIYYISSIYSFILLFTSFSIESGITYFAASEKIGLNKLFGFAVFWSLIVGVIIFLLLSFFIKVNYAGIDEQLLFISSITFICGNLLTAYCTGIFYAKNNFLLPNLVSIIITATLIIILPYHGRSIVEGINDNNYFYLYFGSFLLQGICLAVLILLKYVRIKRQWFLSAEEFWSLFRYCMTAYLANIIFFLLYRIDYWFVEKYCTPVQLGNYIQVSKLGQMFFILPTILASVVFPLTAGGQREKVNGLLTMLSRTILWLYAVVCGLLLLTGKWLFPFIFGNDFTGMYQPFALLIPGILSLSGLFTLTAYYAGKNKMKVNITGSLLALVVIIAGDSIFIPAYGINAAALISSFGYIIYQLYVLIVFNKEYKTRIIEFFIFKMNDWKNMKKILWGYFKN